MITNKRFTADNRSNNFNNTSNHEKIIKTESTSPRSVFDRLSNRETFASRRNNVTNNTDDGKSNSSASRVSGLSSRQSYRSNDGLHKSFYDPKPTNASTSQSTRRVSSSKSPSKKPLSPKSPPSSKTSVFDRLSKRDTFASADMKGKISKSPSKPKSSPSKSKPSPSKSSVFDRLTTSETFASADMKGKISRSKNVNQTTMYQVQQTTDKRLKSPEHNALTDIQRRIKNSLSSERSQCSEVTRIHGNKSDDTESPQGSIDEYGNNQSDENNVYSEMEDSTLFDFIWNKQFDAALSYLNDTYLSVKQIQIALYYQNQDGWNALMRAFYKRPPKYICAPDSLIRDMIDIGGKEVVTMTNVWGDNALLCAVKYKRSFDVIKLLVEVGGGKDYVLHCNFKGKTALHVACEMNLSMETIQCLVDAGGKELILKEDDNGDRAKCRSGDVMDYLIGIGGDMNKKTIAKRPTILHDLIQDKLFDNVEAYLNDESVTLYGKRSAMAFKDKDGWTPLMNAVLKNAPDSIIEQIIFIGGSEILNMTNKWDDIALLYALAQRRSLELIRLFVEKGGGVDCVVKAYGKGLTPLHWACKHNAPLEVVQYLIEEGEKYFPKEGKAQIVSMQSHYHQVPLHLVCTNGPDTSLSVISLLLEACHGKNLQLKDRDFKLPLHIACENKAPFDVIQYLVDHGDNDNLLHCDRDGKIPLHLACENGASLESISYLAKVGGQESIEKVPYLIRHSSVHREVLMKSD